MKKKHPVKFNRKIKLKWIHLIFFFFLVLITFDKLDYIIMKNEDKDDYMNFKTDILSFLYKRMPKVKASTSNSIEDIENSSLNESKLQKDKIIYEKFSKPPKYDDMSKESRGYLYTFFLLIPIINSDIIINRYFINTRYISRIQSRNTEKYITNIWCSSFNSYWCF